MLGFAQKISNAAKQHAENAEGGEFVFADSVNQHADEGAADERADIHYAADKAHHHATGAERFRKAGNYRRYQHWAGHVKKLAAKIKAMSRLVCEPAIINTSLADTRYYKCSFIL